MSAAAALPILYRYAADPDNENPDACQAVALDAEIGAREVSLARMRLSNGRSIAAQASYRCDEIEPTTAACNGTVEDATARPFQTGVESIKSNGAMRGTVLNGAPGTMLHGVYRLHVAQLLDGKGAVRLPSKGDFSLKASRDLMAIAAIYTAPPPWKYRKFVWYYR